MNSDNSPSKNFMKHKRVFKEDEYDIMTTFESHIKRNIARRPRENKNKKPRKEILDDKSSQTDYNEREYTEGCPILNKSKISSKLVKHDPINKNIEFSYEIEMYGPFDYLFELRGNLNKHDYFEKTEKIRNFPKHLKYSLFCNEKIRNIRKNEFSIIIFLFDEAKKTGNKLYKLKKFRESIDNYFFVKIYIK